MSDQRHGPDEERDPTPPDPDARLHQPWRRYVALGESALVAALSYGTWWLWHRGVVTTTLAMHSGPAQSVDRYLGQWLLLAIACATLAGVVLIDCVRQLLLSWPVRPRPGEPGHPPPT